MEKIRELTYDGATYSVSSTRGIIDPGKFNGMALHAVRDYGMQDDSFGDVSEYFAYYWQVGHRYYGTNDQGFVWELDAEDYEAERVAYVAAGERDEALEDARNDLEEALAEDVGPCPQCEALMINGVRCHETGCEAQARIAALRRRVETLEEM